MITIAIAAALVLLASSSPPPPSRDAGILYEVWHAPAAHLARRVRASGATQPLTVEKVIRSVGNHSLGEVFSGPTPEIPPGFRPDIYSVEPLLGFYCLYRPVNPRAVQDWV